MKIYIPYSKTDPENLSGKSLFCFRLASAIRKKGLDVTEDKNKKVDVSINMIRISHENSRKKILRLNGICHDSQKDYNKKNNPIKHSLKLADGVVYQSKHSKKLCDAFLGNTDKPFSIIYNGTESFCSKNIKTPKRLEGKSVAFAFSKWRPHKRLIDIIKSFLCAKIENGALVVAGDLSKDVASKNNSLMQHPDVFYVGKLSQSEIQSYLQIAKCTIHLCWFDACPNSVVESIMSGTPVVSNNVGGTPELVRLGGGVVCEIDHPYSYTPINLYHPPKINHSIVAKAINYCMKNKIKTNKAPFLIDNVADQYIEFITKILKNENQCSHTSQRKQ